jgi:hypothetical protein
MMTLGARNAKMTQETRPAAQGLTKKEPKVLNSEQKNGLGDDEIEKFLQSRSVRIHLIL